MFVFYFTSWEFREREAPSWPKFLTDQLLETQQWERALAFMPCLWASQNNLVPMECESEWSYSRVKHSDLELRTQSLLVYLLYVTDCFRSLLVIWGQLAADGVSFLRTDKVLQSSRINMTAKFYKLQRDNLSILYIYIPSFQIPHTGSAYVICLLCHLQLACVRSTNYVDRIAMAGVLFPKPVAAAWSKSLLCLLLCVEFLSS